MSKLSESAYLVALYRALESERRDALFQDPWARQLAGGQGQLFQALLGHPQPYADVIAIRTHLVDTLIQEQIARNHISLVMNLGAGLDTRPYRLQLPSSLIWLDVDLPDISEYKHQQLHGVKPRCILKQIKGDLADSTFRHSLFSASTQFSKPTIVITEGLLGYWTETQVASLASHLSQQHYIHGWILELAAPTVLRGWQRQYSHTLYDQYVANGKPAFKFAPHQGPAFFQTWGWQVAHQYDVLDKLSHLQRATPLVHLRAVMKRVLSQLHIPQTLSGQVVLLTHPTGFNAKRNDALGHKHGSYASRGN
ncbi:SAM-dependent methyltransferase [Acaryochloris sp. IP29b_bin.148]|uniref:class I SAM-dependent methyltransferase n=1 Tax=Acaryochloris sp. IP29b_bin.148 TaxID=2969218 RepID=UPI00261E2668|nr:SAM-dependent methyltransferase [Acaryochloris sp. IP29b_bin.148]